MTIKILVKYDKCYLWAIRYEEQNAKSLTLSFIINIIFMFIESVNKKKTIKQF